MNRLRAYRDLEGINQTELAQILGISTPMVSAIESGRRPFGGSLEVLGYSDSRLHLPDMSEPIHRARASTAVASKKYAKELLRLAGEVFAELRAVTPRAPDGDLLRRARVEHVDEIEDVSVELRAVLGHEESGPVRNLTALVERSGICLVPVPHLQGLDGISSWVNGVPVIGLNPLVPGDRFRFSLAHECAHLLLHDTRHDMVENEANRFAGAFLFPRDDFDAAMTDKPKMTDFVNLKQNWGLSIGALVYRAHELEYIDDSRYRSLQIQMSKWRRSEPGEFQPVVGTLFSKLIDVNGGHAAVADRLGVNSTHLRSLTDWSRLRLL